MASQAEFYEELHRIADRAKPEIKRQFLAALTAVRDNIKLSELADAVSTGSVYAVGQALNMKGLERSLQPMMTELITVFHKAAMASISVMPKSVQNDLVFDLINPKSVQFLQNYRFQLIGENGSLASATEQGVRQVVMDAFERGGSPYQQAKQIRNMIGLTPRDQEAVFNLERLLIEEGVTGDQLQRRIDLYTKRLLKARAENIARTETIRAANAGQDALWEQAVDDGLIDKEKQKRVWILTPDDRLCPICRQVPGMNPDGVKVGEPFQTPSGPRMSPPLHPRCRCATGLRTFKG